MQELDLNSIRNIQLDALSFFDNFCRKNNLRYSLAGGTLLGAIRHKGYIPWDDDIDLMMPRPDYERFKEIFSGNEKYCIYTPENSDYPYLYTKLCDLNTVLIEKPGTKSIKYHVYLDIYPIDGLPTDLNESKKLFKKMKRRTFLFDMLRLAKFNKKYGSPFHKFLWSLINIFSFFVSSNKIISNITRICKKIDFETSDYIGNVSCGYYFKERMNKDVFSLKDIEFEQRKFLSIKGYDEYLTNLYGDYMQLPPKEKQVLSHDYVACLREDSLC